MVSSADAFQGRCIARPPISALPVTVRARREPQRSARATRMTLPLPPLLPPTPAPSAANSHGMFILASGLAGSGTTALAKILAELDGAIGVETNWDINALSNRSQERHACIRGQRAAVARFNNAIDQLWTDQNKTYALHRRDARDALVRDARIREVVSSLQSLVVTCNNTRSKPHLIVYHRSMPFTSVYYTPRGIRKVIQNTPFVHDLPVIARYLGAGWSSKLAISLRNMPEKWLSHGGRGANMTYLKHVEQLLRLRQPGERPVFVQHRDLVRDRSAYVGCLCRSFAPWSTGCMSNLLESPSFFSEAHVTPRTATYRAQLEKYRVAWDTRFSPEFPSFVRALRTPGSCT